MVRMPILRSTESGMTVVSIGQSVGLKVVGQQLHRWVPAPLWVNAGDAPRVNDVAVNDEVPSDHAGVVVGSEVEERLGLSSVPAGRVRLLESHMELPRAGGEIGGTVGTVEGPFSH